MQHAAADNGLAGYVDRKRRLWLFSLMVPGLALVGPLMYMLVSPNVLWLWLSTIFGYVVIPMLDGVLGEDLSNPPEEAVALRLIPITVTSPMRWCPSCDQLYRQYCVFRAA
ncbi:hypothetical protein ULF88_13775 [Halopseudomonas pachastrellae]|nr:hypothetical protein [Halopseudomonas pachastrellae]